MDKKVWVPGEGDSRGYEQDAAFSESGGRQGVGVGVTWVRGQPRSWVLWEVGGKFIHQGHCRGVGSTWKLGGWLLWHQCPCLWLSAGAQQWGGTWEDACPLRPPACLRLGIDCPWGQPLWRSRHPPSTISKERVFLLRDGITNMTAVYCFEAMCVHPTSKKMGCPSAKWESRQNICKASGKTSEFQ